MDTHNPLGHLTMSPAIYGAPNVWRAARPCAIEPRGSHYWALSHKVVYGGSLSWKIPEGRSWSIIKLPRGIA